MKAIQFIPPGKTFSGWLLILHDIYSMSGRLVLWRIHCSHLLKVAKLFAVKSLHVPFRNTSASQGLWQGQAMQISHAE